MNLENAIQVSLQCGARREGRRKGGRERRREGGREERLEWGIKGMSGRIMLLAGGVSMLSVMPVCLLSVCLSVRHGVNLLPSRP